MVIYAAFTSQSNGLSIDFIGPFGFSPKIMFEIDSGSITIYQNPFAENFGSFVEIAFNNLN